MYGHLKLGFAQNTVTTTLLAAIAILLALILFVLVLHLPEQRRYALLKACLRIYWTFVVLAFLVSWVFVLIAWEVRHHEELPRFLDALPVFFFLLAVGPLAVLDRDEWTSRAKAVRLAIYWTLVAFGFLLFDSVVRIPKFPSWALLESISNSVFGDIIGWLILCYVAYIAFRVCERVWKQSRD